jgi:hypothetical protein
MTTCRIRLLVLSLVTLLLVACTPAFQVQTEYDRKTDFSRLHTWNWAGQSGETQTLAAANTADRIQLDALVRSAVQQELGAKGFAPSSETPDFRVSWSFGEWRRDTGHRSGGGYGSAGLAFPGQHAVAEPISPDGRALPPSRDPYSSAYEQARLAVRITDEASKQVLWEGWVVDNGDFGYFRADQKREITEAMREILKDFPPAH